MIDETGFKLLKAKADARVEEVEAEDTAAGRVRTVTITTRESALLAQAVARAVRETSAQAAEDIKAGDEAALEDSLKALACFISIARKFRDASKPADRPSGAERIQ